MFDKRFAVTAILCLIATLFARDVFAQNDDALTAAQNLQTAFTTVIERGEISVVSIARFKSSDARRDVAALPPEDFVPNEFGSGVLIPAGKQGRGPLVLTNYHVVRGGQVAGEEFNIGNSDVLVRFHDRRRVRASIIAADPRSDLAVLQLELEGASVDASKLVPFELKTVDNIKKGSLVVTLSNPYAISRDGSASAGWGIISNVSRRLDRTALPEGDPDALKRETIHHFGTLLQIDARLNLGASGGALLNLKGELIGITTSMAALDGYEKSAGFAIPFDVPTRRIIDSLVNGYEVEYGFLGVLPVTANEEMMRGITAAAADQPTAARIQRVVANSPAAVGGLYAHDIVLSVNKAPVYNQYDLMREVAMLGPGATAKFVVWRKRDNGEREVYVQLGKWPVVNEEDIVATRLRIPAWRGLAVDYPTSRWKHLPYQLDSYHSAVLITGVAKESAAAGVEIKAGDYITHVNQVPVATPDEFSKVVSKVTGSVALQLADGRRVVIPPR